MDGEGSKGFLQGGAGGISWDGHANGGFEGGGGGGGGEGEVPIMLEKISKVS